MILRKQRPDTDDIFAGNYIMDGKLHALFDDSNSLMWALNFITPLLIECGFTITRKDIHVFEACYLDAERESRRLFLDPAVKEYLERSLKTPRQLTKICRDVLRKHFKGRKIHKFVEVHILPEQIREFILLKPSFI